MPNYSDEEFPELFPLSWIAQYGYCQRRCSLLALEQVWQENEYTAAGRMQHKRVHTARSERRGEEIHMFEMPVFSKTLGVTGFCDCVEAQPCPAGVSIPYGDGLYTLYPIEYKHGVMKLSYPSPYGRKHGRLPGVFGTSYKIRNYSRLFTAQSARNVPYGNIASPKSNALPVPIMRIFGMMS